MRKKKRMILGIMLSTVLLAGMISGCSSEQVTEIESSNEQTQADANVEVVSADMFTDRDLEVGYDETNDIVVSLEGSTATCESDAVNIDGGTVTITEEGTYIFSGSLSDGMIIVEAENTDKIQLVLNGVSINSETSAAIYIKQADKVFITLAADTENTLSNGGTFTAIDENSIDAVIFSKDDLTLNGSGSLVISSPAGHGIVGKDDLVITGGNYDITASSHGLSANDSIRIADGTFTFDTGKHAMEAENAEDTSLGYIYIADGEFTIDAVEDGFNASGYIQIAGGTYQMTVGDDGFHADGNLTIQDGTIDIVSCYEGLEGHTIDVNGGDISLVASDDGLNAAGGNDQSGFMGGGADQFTADTDAYIRITGGILTIDAEGDGIDSNGNLYVDGGEVVIVGPSNSGNGALDYTGEAVITGGTVIATGMSGMAQNFSSSSTQGSIMVTTDNITAGTEITLTDSTGETLISFTTEKSMNSIIISCDQLEEGGSYALTAGSYSTTITLDTLIYSEGGGMGGNGMGGQGMGGQGMGGQGMNGGTNGGMKGGRGNIQ